MVRKQLHFSNSGKFKILTESIMDARKFNFAPKFSNTLKWRIFSPELCASGKNVQTKKTFFTKQKFRG